MLKFLLILLVYAKVSESCPFQCSCYEIYGYGKDGEYMSLERRHYYYRYSQPNYAADCSWRDLKNMPLGIDTDVLFLDLEYNNITSLPNNTFAPVNLTRLNVLYLNNNSISNVETDAFSGLINLKKLVLDGNEITSLPLDVFRPCFLLRYLSLSGNKIEMPHNGLVLQPLSSLRYLYLVQCNLSEIPGPAYTIRDLTVDVSNNQLKSIDTTRYSSILSLNASNNGNIRFLFSEGVQYTSLRVLNLSRNSIDISPENATLDAPNLAVLDISQCNVTADILDIFSTTGQHSVINLSGSNIKELKRSTMQRHVSLRILGLRSNKISFLDPNTFVDNTLLSIVNLRENPLDLPINAMFLNSSSLSILFLSSCNISNLSENTFKNTPSLITIDLSNNVIQEVNDAFHHLHNLTHLSLINNRIVRIKSDEFIHNTQLNFLMLSGNPIQLPDNTSFLDAPSVFSLWLMRCNITHLPLNMFKNTPFLRSLYLTNNSIANIDVGVFKNLRKLSILGLANNPLHCNAQLKEVLVWTINNIIDSDAQCVNPKGSWKMLEHMDVDDNSNILNPTQPSTTATTNIIPTEVTSQMTNFSKPQNYEAVVQEDEDSGVSTAVMWVLLVVGCVVGIVLGLFVDFVVSRRYSCVTFSNRPEEQTLVP